MTEKRIVVLPILDDYGCTKKRNKKKEKNQQAKICLITGRTTGEWILPTGKYESRLSNKKVAALEAFEEAGLSGEIDKKFCKVLVVNKPSLRGKRKIRLYRMRVKRIFKYWPEKKERKRVIVPCKKLVKRIKDKKLAKCLTKLMVA